MTKTEKDPQASHDQLVFAIQKETSKFQEFYLWLEKSMPPTFFEEVSYENIVLIVHSLIGFPLQDYFSNIHLKRAAIVLCLDSADADLKILQDYSIYAIKSYQAYISTSPPPFSGISANLRIAQIQFTEAEETEKAPFPLELTEQLKALIKIRNPAVTDKEFEKIIHSIDNRFLRALPLERLVLALDMFFRAKTRDSCQYEVRYNENWEDSGKASMNIVLAWRNVPKHHFLYRMARIIHRYDLVMKKVHAAYIDPYSTNSILLMSLSLHGSNGKAVWDVADVPAFLRELASLKYFASFDSIHEKLIKPGFIPGKSGNFLRAMVNFIHQILVHLDVNLYTNERIEEDLCRHPEITSQLCKAFELKFDPDHNDFEKYLAAHKQVLSDINNLDTGHFENDTRRKNVLRQGLNLIHFTLKTNYYRLNYTSISFRLDPKYLEEMPFERKNKFLEMPYGIFFIKGMHFFGFHIRFKDLSRGGLRTVYPELAEHVISEENNVFLECYNLAYTQHMKNKDIPEGGSKGVIFLKPYKRIASEAMILQKELEETKESSQTIQQRIDAFMQEQKVEYLYQAQRSFIESLVTIVNCNPDGTIKARNIVDYWKRPEYLYLGPDENMHDPMIQWIADFSKKYRYKPGGAFISGKPKAGINHKEYGVTSLGVNTYMEEALKYLGLDPEKEIFSVKMSGGPDGDVAGNQILNLLHYYPKTAKLVALTDVSGTIYEPKGLDLEILSQLFHQGKPIRYYPPDMLTEGGFLVDKQTKKQQSALAQQTLCWRRKNGSLVEDWLSGSEMNQLVRNNVHQVKTDVFIPSGGRPRTLNLENITEFLDETGKPTSRCIIEGANLYLTQEARRFLEDKGVLIIKDSSANKTGVICSSFEVLCGLVLDDETFLKYKEQLVKEIKERLKTCALNEAKLLLNTFKERGGYLTTISDEVSWHINRYTYELLDHLENIQLSNDPKDPLVIKFLEYALPTLVKDFKDKLLSEIPDHHKKAIIASHIASQLVYSRGLSWHPTIVDVLPVLL